MRRPGDDRAQPFDPFTRTRAYLDELPAVVPPGQVLVHDSGRRRVRAWLSAPDAPGLQPCACAWAPELGAHFTVPRVRFSYADLVPPSARRS